MHPIESPSDDHFVGRTDRADVRLCYGSSNTYYACEIWLNLKLCYLKKIACSGLSVNSRMIFGCDFPLEKCESGNVESETRRWRMALRDIPPNCHSTEAALVENKGPQKLFPPTALPIVCTVSVCLHLSVSANCQLPLLNSRFSFVRVLDKFVQQNGSRGFPQSFASFASHT